MLRHVDLDTRRRDNQPLPPPAWDASKLNSLISSGKPRDEAAVKSSNLSTPRDQLSSKRTVKLKPRHTLTAGVSGLRAPGPQGIGLADHDHPRRGRSKPKYRKVEGDLFLNGVRPDDVDQKDIGTCWILASLAAIAHRDPERIEELITPNNDGSYTVHMHRLLWAVKWSFPLWKSDVVVTPEFPSFAAGTSRRGGKHELWVALIEKAYASWKIGNNYSRINGGLSENALAAFTGRRSHSHLFCRSPEHLRE
ncbi:unnamed protein product, partial [marine sediment metagenome]